MRPIITRNPLKLALVAATLSTVGWATSATAATSAYWRLEGTPDTVVPFGDDTVLDSSGNFNHMRTFDPSFTTPTYTATHSPLPLRSGLANTSALNFGPGGDDDNLNDDIYTAGKPIQYNVFYGMTVELAFNMNSIGGYQAVFGKDGKPLPNSEVPPLKFLIRGDDFPDAVPNQLFVEFIDGNGEIHFVSTRQTVTAGNWNHVAFTLTPTTAELWVAEGTGPYRKLDSIEGSFAAPTGEVLISDGGSYTIGRGMYNNGVTDWADAIIDEVRVSNTALSPSEFLFDTGIVAPGTPGDYNGDGFVDSADYTVWADHFGQTGSGIPGDGNNDGVVDSADYTVWADHFGQGTPPAASIPEPAMLSLTLPALALLRRRR